MTKSQHTQPVTVAISFAHLYAASSFPACVGLHPLKFSLVCALGPTVAPPSANVEWPPSQLTSPQILLNLFI